MILSYFRYYIFSGDTSYSILRVVIHQCHSLAPITSRITLSFSSNFMSIPLLFSRLLLASWSVAGLKRRRSLLRFRLGHIVLNSVSTGLFPPKFSFRQACDRALVKGSCLCVCVWVTVIQKFGKASFPLRINYFSVLYFKLTCFVTG
jgi:hypothetical protein